MSVVLVTGVRHYLGRRVAVALHRDPAVRRVIGIDDAPPTGEPPGGPGPEPEYLVAGLDAGRIGEIISAAGVDTVVHTRLVLTPRVPGGRASMKESNVIGAMHLLAACQHAPAVRKLVIRSSAAVYGTSPRAPAVLTEAAPPAAAGGYGKDAAEVEGYLRGLGRRRPDLVLTVLRFVNFMGTDVDSPLARYFTLPVAPTVLGYDPRLQFVHPSDGAEVMRRVVVADHPGTYNVAGNGVLMLSQCLRRAGRAQLALPAPAFRMIGDASREVGLGDIPTEQIDLLRYGRVVDTGRLEREVGYVPRVSSAAAFAEFLRAHRLGESPAAGLLDRLAGNLREGVAADER